MLKEIISRQKEYLIREKIPFVVEGRQIYLPFMALYLQERCNAEREQREEMRPSAQMLLLHFIYGGAQELSTSQAAKDLELTPTSISSLDGVRERVHSSLARDCGWQAAREPPVVDGVARDERKVVDGVLVVALLVAVDFKNVSYSTIKAESTPSIRISPRLPMKRSKLFKVTL